MRVVVLHLHERQALPLAALLRVTGREIVRMQITGERLGADIKQTLKMGDLLFVVFQRLEILQISEVLAREGVVSLGQAEARLLLGSQASRPLRTRASRTG